jgi:hypothetical protein
MADVIGSPPGDHLTSCHGYLQLALHWPQLPARNKGTWKESTPINHRHIRMLPLNPVLNQWVTTPTIGLHTWRIRAHWKSKSETGIGSQKLSNIVQNAAFSQLWRTRTGDTWRRRPVCCLMTSWHYGRVVKALEKGTWINQVASLVYPARKCVEVYDSLLPWCITTVWWSCWFDPSALPPNYPGSHKRL